MKKIELITLALSLAFCWVHYANTWMHSLCARMRLNPFARKPFTCVKCMCGWFSLALGCHLYGAQGMLFLPAGVFAGALFEAASMRL